MTKKNEWMPYSDLPKEAPVEVAPTLLPVSTKIWYRPGKDLTVAELIRELSAAIDQGRLNPDATINMEGCDCNDNARGICILNTKYVNLDR